MASLSDRLKSAQPNPANIGGCVTCKWWDTISDETKNLVNEWIDNKYSIRQLHQILTTPSDGDEPVLNISNTGFRFHMNHHDAKCRPDRAHGDDE